MIHVLQLLAELVIVLAMLVLLLDYGPVDVHLVAAAGCGAIFLIAVQIALMLATAATRRLRRWWTEPPGQYWKQNSSWIWGDASEDKEDQPRSF